MLIRSFLISVSDDMDSGVCILCMELHNPTCSSNAQQLINYSHFGRIYFPLPIRSIAKRCICSIEILYPLIISHIHPLSCQIPPEGVGNCVHTCWGHK